MFSEADTEEALRRIASGARPHQTLRVFLGVTVVGLEKNTGRITRTAAQVAAVYALSVDEVYRSMAQLRRLGILRREGREHFLSERIAWKGDLERRKQAARLRVVEPA